MNNTMKNLKDEIEGILEAIIGDMDYVSEYCDGTESREQAEESRGKLLAFITSLIEQESERAVREFAQHCDEKDSSYTGMELHQHAEKAEQYLAERKS